MTSSDVFSVLTLAQLVSWRHCSDLQNSMCSGSWKLAMPPKKKTMGQESTRIQCSIFLMWHRNDKHIHTSNTALIVPETPKGTSARSLANLPFGSLISIALHVERAWVMKYFPISQTTPNSRPLTVCLLVLAHPSPYIDSRDKNGVDITCTICLHCSVIAVLGLLKI